MKNLAVFALGLATLTGSPSYAKSPTVLGIALDAPISIPQCDGSLINVTRECWYKDRIEQENNYISDVRKNQTYLVAFPISGEGKPNFLKDAVIYTDDQGIVVWIDIFTHGIDVQSDAQKALLEKFGQPRSQARTPLQNRFGAKFSSIEEEWRVGDTTINFDGVRSSLDEGEISIITDRGKKVRALIYPPKNNNKL